MADDLKDAVERVKAFLDHLDTRPNALIHNQGRTLSREDLRTLLSALDRPEEKKDVLPEPTQPLASQEARGRTEAGGSAADGAHNARFEVALAALINLWGRNCTSAQIINGLTRALHTAEEDAA